MGRGTWQTGPLLTCHDSAGTGNRRLKGDSEEMVEETRKEKRTGGKENLRRRRKK
jgi:hypothetical protein